MTLIGRPVIPLEHAHRHAITRRQRWMLLLAFEVLVFGFAQAAFQPVRQPGITIEMSVTPHHVITCEPRCGAAKADAIARRAR